ncbi:peptidase S9B dipeptidylpeptidase IV domain protein [Actinobacteria bacterium OK074]|nr:peptidase S9B dipeptidylpeptidase IV domain protein [Actinobacteria bacterium OK074]
MAADPFLTQLARTRRFTSGAPDEPTITQDGTTVLFLRAHTGNAPTTGLWAMDVTTGAERLLAGTPTGKTNPTPAKNTADATPNTTPATPTTVDTYATDTPGHLAAFTSSGTLWQVPATGARPPVQPPTPSHTPVTPPRPAPTGRHISYVCDGAVRVIETDGSNDRALTLPATPHITYGTGPHTAATSSDGHPRGHWWSPDGTQLLVLQADFTLVGRWYTTDPTDPAAPPRSHPYAAAGTPNAEVTLWITALNGSRVEASWDYAAFEYVVGAGWDDHGPYAVVQSRDQRTVRFLAIDPRDGRTTVVAEQHDNHWVQLLPGLPARNRSGALIAHADLHGTRHLTVAGTPVTPPGLHLRALLSIDHDEVLFSATPATDPTETHLWLHRPNEAPHRLTTEHAIHWGTHRAGTLVQVTQGPQDPPPGRTEIHHPNRQAANTPHPESPGTPRTPTAPIPVPTPTILIPSHAEHPVLTPHPTQLTLGPTELRAALYLPSWHGGGPSSERLPILLDPYGGAGNQRVTAASRWQSLVSQWFAEHGFAVLVADGRGTPGGGADWERSVYGDLFGPAVEDQVTAVHEAARAYPQLDLGRVGIRGWSFGGSLATAALLRRPDVFHAAAAGAGVTDQRLYDAHWRERSLGHPDTHPEHYAADSLVRAAPHLTRPLLLIHGLADTNVHPANTLRLSAALQTAARPHEVLLLPTSGHQPTGPQSTASLQRQLTFFQAHLTPPENPPTTT